MKNVTTPRLFSRLALSTVWVMGVVSASFADDVNLKTMIPGVPQIDAESYMLIDYNSGKVLAEMNADTRRDPASLTKMMTSYIIGQAIKAGKITPNAVNKDSWATRQSRVQRLLADVTETGRSGTGVAAQPRYHSPVEQ